MAEKREISKHYTAIASAWIDNYEEFAHLRGATIIFLESNHQKKSKRRKVFGLCEKVQEKNKWAIPADFTITFYKPHMELLQEWQQAVVVYHELLHVGYEGEDEPMSTIPHDIEDFRKVIDMFGSHWDEKDAKPLRPELLEDIAYKAAWREKVLKEKEDEIDNAG